MSIGPEGLGHPLEFPVEFKQWLTDYVALNVPKLPVGQVFGFDLQKVKTATVDATEARSATSYGDLATVGPTLDHIANGWYLLIFGADVFGSTTASTGGWMSPSINGAAASDNDGMNTRFLFGSSSAPFSNLRILMTHLTTNDLNTITMKYRSENTAQTVSWSMRFLHAFKVLSLDA